MNPLAVIGRTIGGVGQFAGDVATGAGRFAGDVLKGTGQAVGRFAEGSQQYYRDQLLLRDLQRIQQSTPENSLARAKMVRETLRRHGMPLPAGLMDADFAPLPTTQRYEVDRGETPEKLSWKEYAEARALLSATDPRMRDNATGQFRPMPPNDPALKKYLEDERLLEMARPGSGMEAAATSTGPGDGTPRPGSALSEIRWPRETQQAETMAMAQERQLRRRPGGVTAMDLPSIGGGSAAAGAGSALAKIRLAPTRRQAATPFVGPFGGAFTVPGRPSALRQYEDAGGVTTGNADRFVRSQMVDAKTLAAADRALRAYQTSPEYAEVSVRTGRQLSAVDLTPEVKALLAGEDAATQRELLRLVHEHGADAVLAAAQKHSSTPQGGY